MSEDPRLKRIAMTFVLSCLTLFVGLAAFSSISGEQLRIGLLLAVTAFLAFLAGVIIRKIARSVIQAVFAMTAIIDTGLFLAFAVFIDSLR